MVSCASKVPKVPASNAEAGCKVDCVPVTKAFLKEHAELYDQLIRVKTNLKNCQEKTP
jgi:hypothetical protein